MLKVKRIMTKESEEKVVKIVLEQVRENNMTISNLKEVTAKVVNHLESNATLENEGLDKKVATLEGQVQEQLNHTPIDEEITMESTYEYKGNLPILKAYDPKI